ncbi:MAG: RNA 3'-terminal phosphate cyclase [Pirellulales bacterium]
MSNDRKLIEIDGADGEGGGQIVRSSLALALVTGRPVAIDNIRAGRKKPGLMRQHLTAVQAAVRVGQAEVSGDVIGSRKLKFRPHALAPGDHHFRVGTAGSATLVLQTVLPALLTADRPSSITVEGGTHNAWAPPFDFLARAFFPLVGRMGPKVSAELHRHGFYPAGGGKLTATIEPTVKLAGFDLLERGEITSRSAAALVANLPADIGQREIDVVARKTKWPVSCLRVEQIKDSAGPGNVVLIEIGCRHVTEVFTGFGQRGKRAEDVADEAVKELQAYLAAEVPVGPHLADQLMLPLGIAAWRDKSPSTFRTMPLTRHSTTHLDILRRFLDVKIDVEEDDAGCVVRLG